MTVEHAPHVDPAPAAEPAKAPKEPKRNIGFVAREAIMAGKTNQEALTSVKAEFPDAETTMASINWYRNDLKKKLGKEAVPVIQRVKKEKPEATGAETATEKKEKRRGKAAAQAATLAAETGALLGTEDAGFLG
jgi:hypothetical protein